MSKSDDAEGRRALLLIDFQVDFLSDEGRMPVDRAQVLPVLAATRAAIDEAQSRKELIIKIGNEFPRRSVAMNFLRRYAALAGSPGAQWDQRIDVPDAPYLPKWKGDAFCNPELDAMLVDHRITVVALAGLKANACITATAKAALSKGYRVELLTKAIACGSEQSRSRALARLERAGAELSYVGSSVRYG
jgi:nicotinamidase-related amidase